jgi:hypothetical protein
MAKREKKVRVPVEQLWPDDGLSMEVVGEKLGWARVYWIVGPAPRTAVNRNQVTDPPNAGWSHCFVLPAGGRRVRLFCPYTLLGYDVGEESSEFIGLTMPKKPLNPWWAEGLLLKNWDLNHGFGFQRDYDTCARVMAALGVAVPLKRDLPVDPAASPKKPKGKPAADKLTKPVPTNGRRAEVLRWFMDEVGARSVREAMAEFDTTRSNVLTVLFMLHKEHGIGYVLNGDAAEVVLPKASKKLFA